MTKQELINRALELGVDPLEASLESKSKAELEQILQVMLYPKRRKDGMAFSDSMNAKLVNLDVPESVKDLIDTFFSQTQFFLEGGKWKSAQREISRLEPTNFASQDLINEIKSNIDNYVKESYK